MSRAFVVLAVLLAACAAPVEPSPSPTAVNVPEDVQAWAAGAGDMLGRHMLGGPRPNLRVEQAETCPDYAIVVFRDPDPRGVGFLWAAGALSESPDGADGGFAGSVRDGELEARRAQHGPCRTIYP